MKNIQLYLGDCLKVMKQIPNESIDMILTDIPYGEVNRPSNGLRNLDKGDADIFDMPMNILINEFIRVCRGSFYIFCGWSQLGEIKNILINNKISTRIIIWEKTNPSPMNGQYIWLSGIEPAVYGKKRKATFNEHCKNTVLRYSSGRSKLHPTQKNLDLFEYLINVSSNENDIILDPFLGSGTTAVACKKLNRRCVGIEINEEYIKIAQARIKGYKKEKKNG